ncbi:pyridoxal-dependent decarboxylase, exosortase A system-associated [Aquisalimonas asiatica]|uniref:Diaminopimelate decarboxylase n=1 Tax=Aquisalimonas asiatica TaxID=406100 RepID=A0A1H8U5I8_9GAMM|nr:pyridoxal-dependent decarboxylase, exosortase A system-associated [Aquisalimonas asiatica]SEO98425.1 diaminopimelate decarboxylase [Aquisalimonas asiatica]
MTNKADTLRIPAGFQQPGTVLLVGGQRIDTLAAQTGTPLFAYDRNLIAERVDRLRGALPERAHLTYAVKANPMPELLAWLAPRVDGFDVASAGEIRRALDSGMAPERISFAGPGKRPEELAMALQAGITIGLESRGQLDTLAAIARETGRTPRVSLRLNPDFQVKGSGMRMGGGPQPFGVDAEQAPAMLDAIDAAGMTLAGLHIFAGSQNLRADVIAEAQQRSLDLALGLLRESGHVPEFINLGGGFGIPYFPGEQALDLASVGERLADMDHQLEAASPGTRLVIELGRYIVGEAGVYIARVLDRKTSRGHTYLITDGGMHHHLAASGNLGQVLRKNYPVAVGTRLQDEPVETVTVSGPLCTPLDVLADRVMLPRAEVDDLIVVFQSGAYGLTASPTAFLGHGPAAEILV